MLVEFIKIYTLFLNRQKQTRKFMVLGGPRAGKATFFNAIEIAIYFRRDYKI